MKYILLCLFAFFCISCQQIVNPPPDTYELLQNFPNPFTDTTVILYGIPFVGSGATGPSIRVAIYDRFNIIQAVLVNTKNHPAGSNFRTVWNGRGYNNQKVPPGIYSVELQQSDDQIVLARCVALKQ
jgi:hypothetical protein